MCNAPSGMHTASIYRTHRISCEGFTGAPQSQQARVIKQSNTISAQITPRNVVNLISLLLITKPGVHWAKSPHPGAVQRVQYVPSHPLPSYPTQSLTKDAKQTFLLDDPLCMYLNCDQWEAEVSGPLRTVVLMRRYKTLLIFVHPLMLVQIQERKLT